MHYFNMGLSFGIISSYLILIIISIISNPPSSEIEKFKKYYISQSSQSDITNDEIKKLIKLNSIGITKYEICYLFILVNIIIYNTLNN